MQVMARSLSLLLLAVALTLPTVVRASACAEAPIATQAAFLQSAISYQEGRMAMECIAAPARLAAHLPLLAVLIAVRRVPSPRLSLFWRRPAAREQGHRVSTPFAITAARLIHIPRDLSSSVEVAAPAAIVGPCASGQP